LVGGAERANGTLDNPYPGTPPMNTYELAQRRSPDPDLVLADLAGEVDLTNAPELDEQLRELASNRESKLVLDLNGVEFIDSAALHVIFRTARRLGRERFGIALESRAPVARTLELVKLGDLVTVRESIEEVLPALPAPE
jgi:anti-anti-sigma factor